jgi:toxin ParE1/3/4
MIGFVLYPRARKDLVDIWHYTFNRWGMDQANFYVREIEASFPEIVDNPNIGRPCQKLKGSFSQYPVGSHVIFYLKTGRGIDIVRILHQRMDYIRHM